MAPDPEQQAQAASYADLPWWQVFQDPKLQELIRSALKQNYDAQLATERINAARAQVTITRSSLFPQVAANANFNGGKDGATQFKFNFLTLVGDAAKWISSAACVAPLRRHARSCWRQKMRGKR
jgi:multidrug efflux system outer membrane protein